LTNIFLQGTPVIIGDSDNVGDFYDRIPGSQLVEDGMYTVPCDADIPPISFYIGGREFPLMKFKYIEQDQGSTRCLGAIREEEDPETWVLGAIFMTSYYTVFDLGKAQVGFATLK
jgi:hypothetical protein